MNRYGQQAMQHWQSTMPDRMSALADPEAFFTQMGEDLQQAIEELTRSLAGQDPPQETYMQKVQRINTAKFGAENQVLRQMLLTAQ